MQAKTVFCTNALILYSFFDALSDVEDAALSPVVFDAASDFAVDSVVELFSLFSEPFLPE